jgi:hypothetical protein
LDLGSLGLPGCFLYHDLALSFGLACAPQGIDSATLSLAIPSTAELLNLHVFLQAWTPDATANAAGIAVSNALELAIGSR